jgi:hypothetical protein
VFKNLSKKIRILDRDGKEVPLERKEYKGLEYLEFEGRGDYEVWAGG